MDVTIRFEEINVKHVQDIGTVKILMLKGEKGDTGASGDYATINNKPQIEGVTLSGNKSAADLGLVTQEALDGVRFETERNTSDISDAQSSITDINDKLSYPSVSNWNTFRPPAGSGRMRLYGISTEGAATGSPFSGDSATFFGYVEGTSTYCTQHLTVQFADTAINRNRLFIRSYLGGTWTAWREISNNPSEIYTEDLNTITDYTKRYFAQGGNTCANKPSNVDSFGLEVIRVGGVNIRQNLYTYNGATFFSRIYNSNNDTWSDWYKYTGTIVS